MSNQPLVFCIVGPTACGKTALSVELAKRANGEIVSADAVAVYRRLNIGSAKPTEEERQGIRHHMIDCVDVTDETFTVSVFREKAREAIDSIVQQNKLPIVTGGSGLYLDSVFSDMRFSAPSNPEIRTQIEQEYDADKTAVFEALRHADPITADRLHPNDKKRVVRAMEVYKVTGKPYAELNNAFETAQQEDQTYRVIRIGLNPGRKVLYDRIDKRTDEMVQNGLVEEAYSLFREGLTPDRYRAMQSIGYAQLYDAFLGKCTVFEAIEQIKLDTRHFAKRQITWFKRNDHTIWFDPDAHTRDDIVKACMELIKDHESID